MNRSLDQVRRSITWVLIVSINHIAITPVMAAQPIAPLAPLPVAAPGTSINVTGTTGTVNQTQGKQTFSWNSFDIDPGYKVVFVQPDSSAVAVNKIGGGRPSYIRGVLQSETVDVNGVVGKGGAIYLINNNGIIFGATAQVNVGSLVASTFDADPTNSSIADAINQGKPAFIPIMIDNVAVAQSEVDKLHIDFEAGAKIHTEGANGVMVFAPNIVNKGTIETPDGQTILAATRNNKVYLTPATASVATDQPLLRGFLVEVDSGGNVDNLGDIVANRGNITLLGMAVNQSGRLTATTAAGVGANGSIRLLARDHAVVRPTNQPPFDGSVDAPLITGPLIHSLQSPNVAVSGCTDGSCTGTVTFGKNSVTQVLPDSGTKTQPDAALQSPSVIEVAGKNIALAEGALIHAPAGVITVTATGAAVGNPGASITLGANAKIDASGTTDTVKNIQDNVLDVKLVGTELADVPLQRDGVLSRANVKIDSTLGTSVADISGALANVQRTASERLATGGKVTLTADNVAFDPQSQVDVSGGKITYLGGDQTTTYVHGGGQWIGISKADPNVVYDKIMDVTLHNVAGYVEGKNAGSITIATSQAPALSSGVLKGGVIIGDKQRDSAPQAGSLTLSLLANSVVNILSQQSYNGSVGQIVDRLFQNSGLANVSINAGSLTLAQDAEVNLAQRGKLSVNASQDVDVEGKIRIAGGAVALNNSDAIGDINNSIVVGSHGAIDVSGTWVNEKLNPSLALVHVVDGGSVDLKSGNILLRNGSLIAANAGAWLSTGNKLTSGKGGNISLSANYATLQNGSLRVGELQTDGSLQSYSPTQGGKLAMTANGFIVGASTQDNVGLYTMLSPDFFQNSGFGAYSLTNTNGDIRIAANTQLNLTARNWQLDPRLYAQSSGANISAFASVVTLPEYLRKPVSFSAKVVPDIKTLNVATPKLVVEKDASLITDAGGQISLESQTLQLLVDGKLIAPGGVISLLLDPTADSSIRNAYANLNGNQAIVLGANSLLQADATFVANPLANQSDFRRYTSYAAGSVNLTANNGYIVAEQGSRISVDGATQLVDINQVNAQGVLTRQRVQQAADAGTIHLQSAEGMLFDEAALSGKAAAVAGAKGGRLEVVLDTNTAKDARLSDDLAAKTKASTIHVEQSIASSEFLSSPIVRDSNGIISTINDIFSELTASPRGNNSVLLSANAVGAGGFDQLQLRASNTQAFHGSTLDADTNTPRQIGRIQFDGNVDLALQQSLELNANSLVVNNGVVHASAPYLAWGENTDIGLPYLQKALPQTGGGSNQLLLSGDFIDLIGTLTSVGVRGTFISSTGDIRARDLVSVDQFGNVLSRLAGSLTTYGNLTLQSQQIYPPTAHQFSFAVSGDPNGILSILSQPGTPAAVLSAGGSLNFSAPNIVQSGTVKAPLGSISMTASNSLTLSPGSLTSVALDSDVVPYGLLDLLGNWSVALPNKSITLQAPNIALKGTVDLSGGSDVSEYQFIAGPGGSKDVLASLSATSFAILSTLSLLYAPLNDLDQSSVLPSGWAPGQTISLNRNGVTESYAVLPARYAMLPGAMLVTPTQKYNGSVAPGYSIELADGSTVVAGKIGYAPNGINSTPAVESSLWSAYTLQTHDQVFQRSQYTVKTATQYFTQSNNSSTTGLPGDGGFLRILAQGDVSVAGAIRAAGADGGRGGGLDFVANDINVVHALSTGPHTGIELLDSQLSSLAVDSILLGGSRQFNAAGTALTTTANTVTVSDNAVVDSKEILFAAKDNVQVKNGATVTASGGVPDNSGVLENINVSGFGALLRLSSVRQAAVSRSGINSASTLGTISLANTATLKAPAIAVDVSRAASLNGAIDPQGGSLAFSAPQISIGNGATTGLVLQQSQLNDTQLKQLILSSSGNLDFYSGLTLSAGDEVRVGASVIRNLGAASDSVTINAGNNIVLNGMGATTSGAAGNGGALNLNSKKITLSGSAGNAVATSLSSRGFNTVALNATERVIAKGNLNFDVGAPLTVVTPLLTSADGANLSITSAGHIDISGGNGSASTKGVVAGSFGSIRVTGSDAAIDTAVVLPGGLFTAHTTGANDLAFGDNAQIDVAGRAVKVGNQLIAVDGGSISLIADNGAIKTTAKSRFDVSASSGVANAGSISVVSPNAILSWLANTTGTADVGNTGSSLSIDALTIDDFSALLALVSNGGFNNEIALRQHAGDLTITANDKLQAHAIDIQADAGNIDVAGALSASGGKAGSISLAAGNNLILRNTAILSAVATSNNENGGKVALGARDGYLDLQSGSAINLAGGANGVGGTLDMRVSRTQSDQSVQGYHNVSDFEVGDGVAIKNYDVAVNGARRIDIEAVKKYSASVVSDVLGAIQGDTSSFMSSVESWASQKFANVAVSSKPRVVPGVEIDSAADLVVDTPIDLYDFNSGSWRYGSSLDTPGVLTLRAAGNLQISNNISDGFNLDTSSTCISFGLCSGLASGSSWSLNLIGGADFNAASVLATKAGGTGNVLLDSGVVVRTGTGSLNVSAAGSLLFADTSAAIYTSGSATPLQQQLADGSYSGYDGFLGELLTYLPDYPKSGGDISVRVGKNIAVSNAVAPAQSADWLFRFGAGGHPATWGVVPELFGGGVATLGGGNIDVRASGDISYLQIAAPTTGKQLAQMTFDESGLPITADINSSLVEVNGGGDVYVRANGDIASSNILVSKGSGTVSAGGGLIQGGATQPANLFGIGDASINVSARNGIVVESIYNPTVAIQSATQVAASFISEFFTYSNDAAISLHAATGDIRIKNDTNSAAISQELNSQQGSARGVADEVLEWATVLPGQVTGIASLGNITIDHPLALFPAANGNLVLIAGGNISGSGAQLSLGDGDASRLPSLGALQPVSEFPAGNIYSITALSEVPSARATELELVKQILGLSSASVLTADAHTETSLHINDFSSVTLAAGGDINDVLLRSPKSAEVFAAGNIIGGRFAIQNIRASDVTELAAGIDILGGGSGSYVIDGPGRLDLLAGRDIDLGISQDGVRSQGNLVNHNLSETGATISLWAGLGKSGPDYKGYVDKYIGSGDLLSFVESSDFGGDFISYVKAITHQGYTQVSAAIADWQLLASSAQQDVIHAFVDGNARYLRPLILKSYFAELQAGGINGGNHAADGYARAYNAIDALFPSSSTYQGDIRLVKSSLQSNSGGDINFVAPNGRVDVGLPVSGGATVNVQGIVVSRKGSINGYVNGDINVNRSKIIVQDGGNITLFSRLGSIDAGRGARTALVLPPPTFVIDPLTGNVIVKTPPAISGSGIQSGCSSGDCIPPGEVYLFAPNGKIDAGDAGISSAGNIFLAAQEVVHADVITAGGAISGAPAAPTVDIGLGAGDVAASAVQSAQEAAANAAGGKDQGMLGQRGLALLTVDILGYGSSQDEEDERRKRRP